MIGISYALTTHNEGSVYIRPLLERLLKHIKLDDEIVVVDDYSTEETTVDVLQEYGDKINLYYHNLDNDFAQHKNFVKSKCTKDYIFFIDADENVHDNLLTTLEEILLNNSEIELFYVPRINIVQGITQEHITKWGWNINDKGWINYYDPQGRICANKPELKWEGFVHERIVGHKTHATLPAFDSDGNPIADYCLLHIKDIRRQERQNNFYSNL
jgi:glycosyltransferase involved in cell wall biosynthesis